MARPLEFNREHALTAAMQLFWRQGYTATSMSQLLEAMGIGRSSFYAAFNDKRSLYIEALALFADRTYSLLTEEREQVGPAIAIARFFQRTLFEVPRRRAERGCMMVNTILELADVDDELSLEAQGHLDKIEQAFAECISEAQAQDELPTMQTPEAAARYLMMVNQGLRVASRKRTPRPEMSEMVDTSLSFLGIPTVAA